MRWTRKNIIEEIRRRKAAGQELSFAAIERQHLNLARAASWHFGNWRGAVEAAGIGYEEVSKYRRWSRERIVARIRELHESGADLSWRAVSTRVDPPLAAAALRANGFANWREAIAAAGLEIEDVARYRHWDDEHVIRVVKAMHKGGESVTSKAVQSRDQPLFCAARRRFGSWDEALQHAGIASQKRAPRKSENQTSKPRAAATRVLAPDARAKKSAVTTAKTVSATDAARVSKQAKNAAAIAPSQAPREVAATKRAAPALAKNTFAKVAKNVSAKVATAKVATAKNAARETAPTRRAEKVIAPAKSVATVSAVPKATAKSATAKNAARATSANATPAKTSATKNATSNAVASTRRTKNAAPDKSEKPSVRAAKNSAAAQQMEAATKRGKATKPTETNAPAKARRAKSSS